MVRHQKREEDKDIDRAFAIVQPGDLIVVQVDAIEPMLSRVMSQFERLSGATVV